MPYGDSAAAGGIAGFHLSRELPTSLSRNGRQVRLTYLISKLMPLYPAGTNYDTTNGLDDMTNFTSGTMVGDDITVRRSL